MHKKRLVFIILLFQIAAGDYQRAHAQQLASVAHAESPLDEVASLEQRIEELDQRLRVLARLAELAKDSAAAAQKTQPRLIAGGEGFALRSADGSFQLRLRGYVQADSRYYPGGQASQTTNPILLRRVRPILEATLYRRFDFRFMPDFGAGKVVLYDAYSEARLSPALGIRAGKFKPPIGLERLQSASDLRFVERGLPTSLVPTRDVGIQLGGEFVSGRIAYQAGVFNGVPDLGNGDTDAQAAKDVVARIFFQPFLRTDIGDRYDLGIGLAASRGRETGTLAAPAIASYLTSGGLVFFGYRNDRTAPNTVIASGTRTRISPQAYFYAGRVGLLTELVRSEQAVQRGSSAATLAHTAWQAAGSWFLTGERASFRTVAPRRIFDPSAGSFGALEIAARFGQLNLDDSTFPVFADRATSAARARAWALGVNWHLARGVKFSANYERTSFQGGAQQGNRAPESFIVFRSQTAF